jgi:hypothetical protein
MVRLRVASSCIARVGGGTERPKPKRALARLLTLLRWAYLRLGRPEPSAAANGCIERGVREQLAVVVACGGSIERGVCGRCWWRGAVAMLCSLRSRCSKC